MNAQIRFIVLPAIVMGLFACKREGPQTSGASAPDTIRDVVDSIFPVEEEIRRFKIARNHAQVSSLAGASASRTALVQRFIRALEASDTTELRAMVLDAAEFIDLYYPTSIYARPPYKQSPELSWFMLQQNSEKGITRALRRHGGAPPGFQRYECEAEPVSQGPNVLWRDCRVQWAPASRAAGPLRLFGPILERDGRFKFLSFANDL